MRVFNTIIKCKWVHYFLGLILLGYSFCVLAMPGAVTKLQVGQWVAPAKVPPSKVVVLLPIKGPRFSVILSATNLKANLKRICQQNHWILLWKLHNKNFKLMGQQVINANSFSSLIEKILTPYPVRVALYQGNHVLVIQSRVGQ